MIIGEERVLFYAIASFFGFIPGSLLGCLLTSLLIQLAPRGCVLEWPTLLWFIPVFFVGGGGALAGGLLLKRWYREEHEKSLQRRRRFRVDARAVAPTGAVSIPEVPDSHGALSITHGSGVAILRRHE